MIHLLWILTCLLLPGLQQCSNSSRCNDAGFGGALRTISSLAARQKTSKLSQHLHCTRNVLGLCLMHEDGVTTAQEHMHEEHALAEERTSLRSLQQEVEGAEVNVVDTPEQLLDAVELGAENIEIAAHLDLTRLSGNIDDTSSSASLLNAKWQANSTSAILPSSNLRSIRGNCRTPPIDLASLNPQHPSSPSSMWKERFCHLTIDAQFLTIKQHMWLDRLHFVYKPATASNTSSLLACEGKGCNLWLTGVHLQGYNMSQSEGGLVGGLHVVHGQVYSADLYVTDFTSSTSPVRIEDNSTVTLEGCTLTRNDIIAPPLQPNAGTRKLLNSSNNVDNSAVISVSGGNNIVRMQQAEIALNSAPHEIIVSDSKINPEVFSDDALEVYYVNPGVDRRTAPLSMVPGGREGINMQSQWFLDMRESMHGKRKKKFKEGAWVAKEAEKGSKSKRDDSRSALWVILGLVGAIVVCLAVPITMGIIVLHRRMLRLPAANEQQEGMKIHRNVLAEMAHPSKCATPQANPQHLQGLQHENEELQSQLQLRKQLTLREREDPGISIICRGPPSPPDPRSRGLGGLGLIPPTTGASSTAGTIKIESHPDTLGFNANNSQGSRTVLVPQPPPREGASTHERRVFVQQQLDGFGTDVPVVEDLLLLGHSKSERRKGGQSVVQMAVSKRTRMDYAIKFFLSRAAFQEEHALYHDAAQSGTLGSALSQFLPKVLVAHANNDGSLVDMDGHALPPCIVMERGTSLDVWAQSGRPDRFQATTVMSHVAVRLRDLHELGYVHRDLKPGNVMWLPRENRWTLIDFGCVARTGQHAKLAFSVAYAAPEVINAYRRGEICMVAKEAADAWSLGVMAFELLTGKQALPMVLGKEHVMDLLQGRGGLQLPWEGDKLTGDNRRKLGVFKTSILSLLQRDPAHRPSMEDFCETCNQVLAGVSSVQL